MATDIVLVRHGETEWSREGRHTSRTDVPLTQAGRRQAERLRGRMAAFGFASVLVSPMARARETAAICGLGTAAEVDDDLREWDYGEVEGLDTEQVRAARGDARWTVWRDDLPGGETLAQVGIRADRVIERVQHVEGTVALFGHAHCLRILTARWLELEPVEGRRFVLATGTLSRLGYERETRAVLSWNT